MANGMANIVPTISDIKIEATKNTSILLRSFLYAKRIKGNTKNKLVTIPNMGIYVVNKRRAA
jgi:hypothetical protein